jgi:hypothetical protein
VTTESTSVQVRRLITVAAVKVPDRNLLRARITGGGPVQLFTPWSRMY